MATAEDQLTSQTARRHSFDADFAAPGALADAPHSYLADETTCVSDLLAIAEHSDAFRHNVHATASDLVAHVRKVNEGRSGLDAFLQKYDLSSQEGIMLMCIAEALLRIPDADTADKLIADKISMADWSTHLGTSDSLFVNASTWGLMLTGKMLSVDVPTRRNPSKMLKSLVSRAGEPVVRSAMRQAMKIMGHQYVMGRTIDDALKRARKGSNKDYRYSYDMLGEAALTRDDAQRYFDAYANAIDRIGASHSGDDVFAAPSISVKLSALHPRYEFARRREVVQQLGDMLLALAVRAKSHNIALTMDAEEADRLELSLDIFERVYRDASLDGYAGLGLAVQAYQKRASGVIGWLTALSRDVGRRIPVRLVKGAYWDTEIKHAQELGLAGYPVFTRKVNTDVSYLACARLMLTAGDAIYGQFATHNAHTLAYVLQHANGRDDFEFQRLHGMGEELYDAVVDKNGYNRPCRVYAPVGSHEDLLPYLVRRLLENGANTSFVNRIVDAEAPIDDIIADPISEVRSLTSIAHPKIVMPVAMFGERRANSQGVNLPEREVADRLMAGLADAARKRYTVGPLIDSETVTGERVDSVSPFDEREQVGSVQFADADTTRRALDIAVQAWPAWRATPATQRASALRRAADLFETHTEELLALCVREAGKSIPDAIAELREAVDFLRYYAAEAEARFSEPTLLPGPTGERNVTGLRGRGVFVCISPWNFPLAIFAGQVAAALAAGNCVIAKPAEQTSIVAIRASELLIEAGIPRAVFACLPGTGKDVGGTATSDPRVAGVAFTGSTATALTINRTLAARDGQIGTLIAETGGQNAMVVDSSALPEQVVLDAVMSGFNSAGQRCSALRVLCVQSEVAPRVIELLEGAMDELVIGDPSVLATDVGPVIDEAARGRLDAHVQRMCSEQKVLKQCDLPSGLDHGIYFPPTLIEIDSLDALKEEVFGPVVHVLRYKRKALPELIEAINNTGYGLTFGIHSRIDGRVGQMAALSYAGNVYINRNMVGAVVGVQPFGGSGLSGTGPKAGGPHYLTRFASEYTVSNNTAAVGGNASLLSLD
ncbi:MAG: bifunctional proline dehydrogenase/L-glutamate gamma-semialdehyde dehydrogenase PutA [Pseudomonadota bacterium]